MPCEVDVVAQFGSVGVMSNVDVVRRLWARIEARDWEGLGALLHEDVVIEWPHTGERIRGRDNYVAIQREYPGNWRSELVSLFGGDEGVASTVRVIHEKETCYGCGVYQVERGLVLRGVEYWTTANSEEPPAWRGRFTSGIRNKRQVAFR